MISVFLITSYISPVTSSRAVALFQ